MLLVYFTIILLSFYSLLVLYYAYVWSKIPGFYLPKDYVPKTMISLIIPARDEELNIASCLHSLAGLDYPESLLEIIVVNDHSTDQTESIVRTFHLPNLKLISPGEHPEQYAAGSKKKAIETGIEAAGGELIVTTDADCIYPRKWMKMMAGLYETSRPVFIAAPVGMMARWNPLAIFQVLDFISLQGITAASVYQKIHPMCNGANLGYEKKVFIEAGGFRGIDHIASGDDMLLMQKISRLYPNRVGYLKSQDAIVQTSVTSGLKAFLQQRIRWSSKALHYQNPRIFIVLLLVYLLNLALFLLMVISFFNNQFWKWSGILLLLKCLVELVLMIPVARFLKQQKWLWFFLPAQPFHVIYTVIAGFFGQIGSYEWKGRRVR